MTQQTDDFAGKRLLIVDDDEVFRQRLARAMERRGFVVTIAEGVETGSQAARGAPPDFAVGDLRLGDGSGLSIVQVIREVSPEARVIVPTGYGNIATAVAAMKACAL